MGSILQDANYLRDDQYKSGVNLSARIALHTRFSTSPIDWYTWVFDQYDAPYDAKVLELGAGTGALWKAMIDRVPAGWQITLSDFSPGMVEEQRRNLKEVPHLFNFEVINAENIPYEDVHFDKVIANHMLYHVADLPKAIGEIRRVLKPGGKLYAATNGISHMHELDELAKGYDPTTQNLVDALKFTLKDGADQLAAAFRNVEVRHYEDALVVTEVEPIVAYILSGWRGKKLNKDAAVADFAAYVEREMKNTGAIHISKDVGMFVAW
jgi:ubiquinone/menaquinone biosynthesis C-methylase UbiE